MPITGLPDPAIHRKCKRCGTWFHLHEGALTWPPKRGLLSFVHVTLAESTEQDAELKFYCVACQERNALDEGRFRKMLSSFGITLLVLIIALPVAYALGAFSWIENLLRAH